MFAFLIMPIVKCSRTGFCVR